MKFFIVIFCLYSFQLLAADQPKFEKLDMNKRVSLGKIRRLNEIEAHLVKLTNEVEALKKKVAYLENNMDRDDDSDSDDKNKK